MLRRLYNRLDHPNPYQRLGATMALYRLYPLLVKQRGIVDRHIFELFFYCAKSLRLAEADAETIGELCALRVICCPIHVGRQVLRLFKCSLC